MTTDPFKLRLLSSTVAILCLGALGCAFHTSAVAQDAGAHPAAMPPARPVNAPPRHVSPYQAQKQSSKAQNYYVAAWGVEKMRVSYTSSGNLIRFSYRVLDPVRAATLNDKKYTPYMLGQRSQAVLQVPVMDKVGALRQAIAPQPGQDYWMVFSNKGNLVRPGDRVNVMIGDFHADGLVVE